jgi:phage FluMu protein Com
MVFVAVKEENVTNVQKANDNWPGEVVIFCPRCKALQTVLIYGKRLMPTRKYFQVGNLIYHDCGSNRACRLYGIS